MRAYVWEVDGRLQAGARIGGHAAAALAESTGCVAERGTNGNVSGN